MQEPQHAGSSFIASLYAKAEAYFNTRLLGKYASPFGLFKGFFFVAMYVVSYYWFLFQCRTFQEMIIVAVLLGASHIFIPVTVSHDAIHQALASSAWLNRLGVATLEIVGANAYMYRKKHLEAHAAKEQGSRSGTIETQGLLIQKKSQSRKVNLPPFLYVFYAQYMIFIRDFVLFSSERDATSKGQYVKLCFSKALYLTAYLVIPFVLIPLPWWQIAVALEVMYLTITALLVLILLMPTERMEHGKLTASDGVNDKWVLEILEHNVDFSPGSRVLTFFVGGANLNVVHYFFPGVHHVHYNYLAALIEATAKEWGLEYRKQEVKDVFGIHFNYLRNIQHLDKQVPEGT